jgi:hypothetical protein
MLQWETVDLNAYRAVSGNREFRVFHNPEAASEVRPWILTVREVGEDGVQVHDHHGTYRIVDEAKESAENWEGPPHPPKG